MSSAASVASLAVEGDIAILTIDSPPVNALSQKVREGILTGVREAVAMPAVKAVVLICAGRTFIAGADITEFGKPPQAPSLVEAQNAIENSAKPVIAAIHGTALGGGLEVALCCHYRVAVPTAKCGLPEVKLGLLPGAGGTQRLPRIVGPAKATEMILTGDQITAQQAMQLRLVNMVVPGGEVMRQAKGLAAKLANKSAVATAAAMTAIRAGLDADLPDGLAAEREQLAKAVASADAAEGVTAFLQKREAKFQDK